MFNLFKSFFKKVESEQTLEIGKMYKLRRNEDNPFEQVHGNVKIKDIQNGWVLYEMNPELKRSLFKNESMKVCTFEYCYEEIQ